MDCAKPSYSSEALDIIRRLDSSGADAFLAARGVTPKQGLLERLSQVAAYAREAPRKNIFKMPMPQGLYRLQNCLTYALVEGDKAYYVDSEGGVGTLHIDDFSYDLVVKNYYVAFQNGVPRLCQAR